MILLHAKKVGCRSDFSGGMPLHSWSGPLDEPHERDEDDGSHEADEEIAQEAASHGEVAEEKTSEPASCDARKVVPPQREILRGIYLSFFPGAKIGILGLNGAGKSTVLRILAGVDKEFTGEAYPAGGTRIGYLSQDPQLDPKKTVLENVEDGVRTVKELLKRFDELGE